MKLWDKFGKYYRVFLTSGIKGSLRPLAKNLLIPFPIRKNAQYIQYVQNVVISFKKGCNCQKHSLPDFHHLQKKCPQQNFTLLQLQRYPNPLKPFQKLWISHLHQKRIFLENWLTLALLLSTSCFPSCSKIFRADLEIYKVA